MFGDGHLQPVIGVAFHVGTHGGAERDIHTRVVTLPRAGETDVAEAPLGAVEYHRPAAIGHVVPQQAAGLTHVHRLGQNEAGDVTHLAVGVFGELDILDEFVDRISGIEFAERTAGDLFVLAGIAEARARCVFAKCR